jgi:hypothetical protein
MSEEEVDSHVTRKYSLEHKLGKGVSHALLFTCTLLSAAPVRAAAAARRSHTRTAAPHHMPLPQAYGVVWKALDKKSQNTVALKKIFDAFQNATDAQVGRVQRSRRVPTRCTPDACAIAPRGGQ